MSSKNCSRCGHASSDDALFCPRCGNSLGAAADPLVGTVIADRYLLIEKVGAGNSGTIYRGEHTTLRKKVAVKVLHHELSTDEKAMERFQREATTVGELDNEHIVQVIDFGRAADGRLFFAQEYLDGETLASLLQREHQLAIPRTIDIVGQIAEALMEAHALGYVHRDLRPRNVILIKKRGRVDFVKLLDFGLSKLVMPSDPKPGTTQVLSIGDPRYMAPELARGETVDRRADLYSLGVIAFEMLTGAVPFEGTTPAEVLQKIGAGPAPSVRARRSDCPEWLDKVVQTALQRDPERRFITVLKMQEHLAAQSAPQVEDVAPAPVAASRNETKPFPLVDLSESAPAPQSAKAAEPPRAPVDEVKKTPEPAPVAANRPMPSPVVASRPEPSPVVASRPEPAPVVASKPEPVPVAVKREEPRPAPAPAPDRRAEEARAAAQAARPATVQPGAPMQFGGKKSKKQMKEDRRREEEKRRKEEARPQAMTAQPPAPQAPAAVAAKSESGAATMSQSARPADRSSSSGESDTGRRAKAGSSDVGAAKVQLSPDLATRAETKNGTDKRVESSRFTKAGMPETGEHERVWFDDSSSPKPLADGEEHYDDDKRKNLGLYVGFAVPTVLVVVLVTAVVLWRVNAPRQEEKHRSYDDETTVSVKAAPDKERVPGQPGEAAEGQAAENPPPQVAAPVVVIDEAARAKAEAEVKAGEEAVERERAAEEAKAKEEAKARMSPEERAALEAKEKEDAKIAAKQKIADEAKAKEDAKVLAKAEAKAKAEAEAKAKADEAAAKKAEAKAKAEAEAKAKADAAAAKKAEAKAKAEAEMLAKGDTAAIKKAEAKAKAEADAQAKADAAAAKKAEAKSKADAEAQAKADAAAAKKAEAKAKGDTEAKAKPVKTTPTKEATASAAGATKETFAGGGGGGGEAEFYLKLGRQKLNAGDYSGATSNFKKAISLDSKSGEGQAGLGEVSFEQGDYGQAAAALRKAIAVAPKKSRYHLLLGQALYKEGLYAEAGGECKRVLTSEPGNQEAKRCAEAANRKLGH